jgi:uncharacterized damage-inducible protein DinB
MATFNLDALRELLAHMEWADATVWRALLAHPPAGEDRRVRDLLMHLHGVQQAFLKIWTSGPQPFPTLAGTPDLAAVQAWVVSYYSDLAVALAGFDEGTLARPTATPGLVEYETRMGRRFDRPTLAETIVQVASHSTYHRGQLNARLRDIGGEPPLVDYIAWIWFGRPAAEWIRAG